MNDRMWLDLLAENQGNFTWMIDPAEEDPGVWLVRDGVAPVAEREPLSGFLVQFCLFEAVMSASSQAFCWSGPAVSADQVTAPLRISAGPPVRDQVTPAS